MAVLRNKKGFTRKRDWVQFIKSICTVYTEFLLLKYHKISIVASSLLLPLPAKFQFCFSILSIKIVTFGFNQNNFGSITKLVGFRIPDIFPPAHVK